jgi:lipopolysaccharide transport system permease protein
MVIEADQRFFRIGLREIWHYRELLYFMIWRDLKVRYKQTILGASWAVLQPLATMMIFTLVFSIIARFPSDGLPYPVFAYCALLPWYFFSKSVTSCSMSIVSNDNLIKKVYFPRLILPIATVLTNIVDFILSFFILLGLMLWFKISLTIKAFAAIFFLLFAFIVSLSIGLWLAVLNVRYRDINHIIPFLLQLWMYLTPNFYPVSFIPEKWRPYYMLNPMVGVVEGFRWALLNKPDMDFTFLGINISMMLILLIAGLFYFEKTEKTFADVI